MNNLTYMEKVELKILLEEKIRENEILIKNNNRFIDRHKEMDKVSLDLHIKINTSHKEQNEMYRKIYEKLSKE